MSDQVWIALIAAIPSIIAMIGTVWVKINQSRMKVIVDSTAAKVDEHGDNLVGIRHELNHMKDVQVADARTIGHSEGIAQEQAREKSDSSPPKV
jgi:hypothetical protein